VGVGVLGDKKFGNLKTGFEAHEVNITNDSSKTIIVENLFFGMEIISSRIQPRNHPWRKSSIA
jgi:hypothetical protein